MNEYPVKKNTTIDTVNPEEIEYLVGKNWYVVYTYSGVEQKVKQIMINIVNTKGYKDIVHKIFIPIENIIEIKRGVKRNVERKIFPGYILVQADKLTDDLILEFKSIQGVSDFVTAGQEYGKDPLPLPKTEVRNLLEKAVSSPTKPKMIYDIGDSVSIMSGPFADFVGTVDEVDMDKGKLKIMVDIFGRKTSVELNFDQVEKQEK
jgi:transcriptional antiterminator NusG